MATTSNQAPQPGRKRPRRQRSTAATVAVTIGKVVGTLLLIGIITTVILICFAARYIQTVIIPQAHVEANFVMDQTSIIYYEDPNTGEYVEHLSLHGDENRILVDYEDIPEDMIKATVAIEDRTFWEHHGVNWRRTLYGVILMFTGQDIQGGSTITQQFIKNFTGYDDVTVKRKIQEIFTALDFEKNYSKAQILEWYLNYIYLGDGCNGVATAAEHYFGKDLSELSLAECASIISITNNPTIYGPNSNVRMTNEDGEVTTGRERNKQRQELVLWTMWDQGIITEEEYQAAVAEELVFTTEVDEKEPDTIYNWYDEQLITDVMNDLMEQYGYSSLVASDMVYSGGLRIYACVDQNVQSIVESVYSDRSNLDLTSNSGQEIQSAIVIVDPEGNIVGLAGALGDKTTNRGWNYASHSRRQPGSSIKPLSVYAPALEAGLITPASVFDDYPVQVLGGSAWPLNNPQTYRGLVTVADALRVSSNPAAVRVLQMLGFENSFNFMQDNFHIDLEEGLEVNGEIKNDLGSSQLALGGLTNGVRVIDMATAYSVFPRDGLYIESRTYTQVTRIAEDGTEEVILDNTNREPEAVLSSETTYYINDMLKDVVTGGNGATGTAAQISGMTVAGKTGSTNSNTDRWFVGYTPYYTAAVWVGFETPARVPAPGNPAAQMFQKVMAPIHDGLENTGFTQPSGLTQVSYCLDCGGEATTACQSDPRGNRVATAYVFAEDRPSTVCTCHSLEEGSNSMVRVCVDDPVLDANGEFTGYYHLAGPNCPEVSIRTYSYLNLDRESVGGAVAEDSQYFYSAYVAAAGTEQCTVHGEGGQIIDPDDPNGVEDPNGDPGGSGDEPGTGDSGGDSSGSSSQPGTDDPGTPGSSSSSTTDPMGNNSEGGVAINPETGRPYGY